MKAFLLTGIFFLAGLQSGVESQPQPEQSQELRRIREQLQQIAESLDRHNEELRGVRPGCGAEIRTNGMPEIRVAGGDGISVPLSLFGTVSRPTESCLPAELHVSASYFDASGHLVCSGSAGHMATQHSLIENVNFDIRPWNLDEFVRRRNDPPAFNDTRVLVCLTPDGLRQITRTALERVRSLRIYTTLLPQEGGVASAEFIIELIP